MCFKNKKCFHTQPMFRATQILNLKIEKKITVQTALHYKA